MNWNTLIGLSWGSLDDIIKKKLMCVANCVDAHTGNNMQEYGDCTIDFQNTPLSIPGRLIKHDEEDEIIIDDEAILYTSFQD